MFRALREGEDRGEVAVEFQADLAAALQRCHYDLADQCAQDIGGLGTSRRAFTRRRALARRRVAGERRLRGRHLAAIGFRQIGAQAYDLGVGSLGRRRALELGAPGGGFGNGKR